jgi:hypothetical protein
MPDNPAHNIHRLCVSPVTCSMPASACTSFATTPRSDFRADHPRHETIVAYLTAEVTV